MTQATIVVPTAARDLIVSVLGEEPAVEVRLRAMQDPEKVTFEAFLGFIQKPNSKGDLEKALAFLNGCFGQLGGEHQQQARALLVPLRQQIREVVHGMNESHRLAARERREPDSDGGHTM